MVALYQLASRFIETREIPGPDSNPLILAMLRSVADWPSGDDVPWCSAFVWFVAHLLDLPRPVPALGLRARSWLQIGTDVALKNARVGGDVVIFTRGDGPKDASIIDAPGHVGFYAGHSDKKIYVLGGNQSDAVNIRPYPSDKLLGVRRLVATASV